MTTEYKNGPRPLILNGARISGGPNQKEASLEDQEDHAREVAAIIYHGVECDFIVCAVKVKGERLDRADLSEIEAHLQSGTIDLFLVEDVGRLVRGTRAKDLFCLAVKHGTRAIAINNDIDTIQDKWESKLIKQCGEEVDNNETVSIRVKFKTGNRYRKHGITPRRPLPGYIVPPGTRCLDDWQRDDAATPVIRHGADIFKVTGNKTAVADYFNTVPFKGSIGFPVGPCCRTREQWDGQYVGTFFANPLICGKPARRKKINVKDHDTGRRRPERNTTQPILVYDAPHLAHISEAEFEELNERQKSVNGKFARKTKDGRDPLSRVVRGVSVFPGMHAKCVYCEDPYCWGANGVAKNLSCRGSRNRTCWNSCRIRGPYTNQKLAEAITDCLFALEGLAAQYESMVEQSLRHPAATLQAEIKSAKAQHAESSRALAHISASIAKTGLDDEISKLQETTRAELKAINRRLAELNIKSQTAPEVPQSVSELQMLFESALAGLMSNSRSAATELKAILPSIDIELVAYVDKPGYPLPRARVIIDFTGMISDAKRVDGLPALLRHERVINLFEIPQRGRIREEVVRIKTANPKLTYKEIATQILDQDKHPTDTAVGNALKLHAKMLERGLTSPLVRLDGPETLTRKFKRPHHKNYRQKQPDASKTT